MNRPEKCSTGGPPWKETDSSDPAQQENIDWIRANKDTVIGAYKSQPVNLLPAASQVTYFWHLASLMTIYVDFLPQGNHRAIGILEDAQQYLDKAFNIMDDKEKLTAQDIIFLKKHHYRERIKRTRLNAMSMMHSASKPHFNRHETLQLRDELGGCDILLKNGTNHLKILTALECLDSRPTDQYPQDGVHAE